MSFSFSKARRLFSYAGLGGSNTSNVDIEGAQESPMQQIRRKHKMIAVVVFLGLAVVLILALTAKDKGQAKEDLHTAIETDIRKGRILNQKNDVDAEKRPVTLSDFSYYRFATGSAFNGTWISDHEIMYKDAVRSSLNIIDVSEPRRSKCIMSCHGGGVTSSDQWLSQDRKFLLLQKERMNIYRSSSISQYMYLPLEDGKVSTTMEYLQPSATHRSESKFVDRLNGEPEPLRLVVLAPKGNAVAYVDLDGNLYYRSALDQQSEEKKLTTTGEDGSVYHGIPDWVFEEEVFEGNSALWWAPDAKKLVWGTFNDTNVEVIRLKEYGNWRDIQQYPTIEDIPYPKVNTTNPNVTLWMTNMESGEVRTTNIPPPESMKGEEVHFSWVTFASDNLFAVQWMNRVQDRTVISLCKTSQEPNCQDIFENKVDKGWVDYKYRIFFDPNFKEGNDAVPGFVTVLAALQTEEKYKQVVHVSMDQKTYLTNLKADVAKILSWSPDGYIYFLANIEGRPTAQHIYKVAGPELRKTANQNNEPVCMTCEMDDESEPFHTRNCSYFEGHMSTNSSYFVMSCLGPDVPYTCIHKTSDNKYVGVYKDNNALESRIQNVALPKVQILQVPVSDYTTQKAQVKLYLPPDLDETKKYPLLIYVYGGPGSQFVNDKFNFYEYQTYMAGAKGFIYAIVDAKGTGGQGEAWMHSVYHGFGTNDVQSTIEVAKYLKSELKYVDSNRTAIWGWSYGGFLSLSVLGNDEENVFACGASVAPVTDWMLYDTYYTERYMGRPIGDNVINYDRSRVVKHLAGLKGKAFYLMHGTFDDNVHYQQSMLLSAALESQNILFRQQSYPDQTHSISDYQQHLYHSLTDFFLNDCFTFKDRKSKK